MDKSYALYKEVDFHFNNGAEWDEWIQANANRVVKEILQGDIKPMTHLKMREIKNLSPVDVVLVIIYYPHTPDTEEEEISLWFYNVQLHQVGDGAYTYGTTKQWKGSKYEKVEIESKWEGRGKRGHDTYLSFCLLPSEVDLTHPQKEYLIYLVKPNKGTKFMNWAENPFGREG